MTARYVLALDQGTSSSRAILFDERGTVVSEGHHPVAAIFPQPGWVEQDPIDLWRSQIAAVQECLRRAGVQPREIAAVGIANQRETTVVWHRHTGQPVYNAIVWQCRRTAPECEALEAQGVGDLVRNKTGLRLDPYFSGTKLAWVLNHVDGARAAAQAGDLLFGTVDSWLVFNLTGGRDHLTDPSNASRTLLYNIHSGQWDMDLLSLLDIPASILPRVVDSSGTVAYTDPSVFGASVPIAGIAGDQQAALFGNGCWTPGAAKNTYGTGCFVLMNTGLQPVSSDSGLLTTIAWQRNGQVEYALEGSVFVAGAAVQWLKDGLGLIETSEETESVAESVANTGDVYVVPAFVGLGAPYWDPHARGIVVGMTQSTTRAHIIRAVLEAIAHQTADVVHAMNHDSGRELATLRTDGKAISNRFLAQFQADVLGVPVVRPRVTETTALGAAYLAGLGVGLFESLEEARAVIQSRDVFTPQMAPDERAWHRGRWAKAVRRARGWTTSEGGDVVCNREGSSGSTWLHEPSDSR